MAFIKATKKECEDYNNEVVKGEGYKGSTTAWATPIEVDGVFYILVNEKYPTALETVDNIPEE